MESPLDAREKRWRRRLDLAAALPPGCSLLSFTLRMPAPLRLGGGYDRAAGEWFDELRGFLAREGLPVLSYEFRVSADGPEGFCAVRGEGNDVKRRAVAFEETDPCGALGGHHRIPIAGDGLAGVRVAAAGLVELQAII